MISAHAAKGRGIIAIGAARCAGKREFTQERNRA